MKRSSFSATKYGNDPETGYPYFDDTVCPKCSENPCACDHIGPDPENDYDHVFTRAIERELDRQSGVEDEVSS